MKMLAILTILAGLFLREPPVLAEDHSLPASMKSNLATEIDQRAAIVESKVIAWRRDIHQNPELGNREVRTAKLVADHLRSLGLEVQTGVAHTGVVGLLRGEKPGPVVALRADMDALPVAEEVNIPFASKVKSTYNGQEVGVMHACGHDTHTAILMGVAEILSGLKPQLQGSVKFIFQPAEEGPPTGEEGGAALMIKQGVLENPKPDAIFGLHVTSSIETGKIAYRSGPLLASGDMLHLGVRGQQTHGAAPWRGIDPIVVASQIVLGLQTIESRQVDVTKEPSIITIGSIHGGVRFNIIPDSVEMDGTIRTYDEEMRSDIHQRIKTTAEMIAKSAGASAEVKIDKMYSVTINHAGLTEQAVPTLIKAAGGENANVGPKLTASEDFSEYQKKIPGFFFFIGVTPKGTDVSKAASNHSPRFFVDESGLLLGVRSLAHLTVDYMAMKETKPLP
ncbi:MAG: amidohydrolase [Deltaproteobacteria bacterium]|nr:amidohydrolase [Deltaproteobacteria bacterium]